MNQRTIDFAAKWWADTLRTAPKHNLLGASRGRSDETEVVGEASLNIFASMMPAISDAQIDVFEKELMTEIKREIDRQQSSVDKIRLDVDYDPNPPLAKAAAKAGFDPKYRLPCKTTMFLTSNGIELKEGHGAPYIKFKLS